MATTIQKKADDTDVLLQTWQQLAVYDTTASKLKQDFIRRRYHVISLTLTATICAILTGLVGHRALALLFGLLGVTLPIVSTYLMNDISKFTGTTTWIKYRYIAESMRMHLFLYRMKAGPYAAVAPDKADNLLSQNITTAREEIRLDDVIPFKIRAPQNEEEIREAIRSANSLTPADDGICQLTLKNYIDWRVAAQRTWYDGRIHDDYSRLKSNWRWSQAFLLAGALISALAGLISIEVVSLVAVTSAISVALTSYSGVSMFGRTYGLYFVTNLKLADLLRDWVARSNDAELHAPQARADAERAFVVSVEEALRWERKAWFDLATQAQTSGDQTILNSLEALTRRSDTHAGTPPTAP